MLQPATFFRILQQSIATACGKRSGKCRSRTVLSVRISTPQRKIPRRWRHRRAGLRAAGRRRFHRLHDRGKDRVAGAGVRHRRSRPDRSPDCRGGLSYRENRRRVRRPTNGGRTIRTSGESPCGLFSTTPTARPPLRGDSRPMSLRQLSVPLPYPLPK